MGGSCPGSCCAPPLARGLRYSYGGVAYLVLLAVLALVYLRGRQRPTLAQSLVLLALVVAALAAQRHVPLLGLAVPVLAGSSLQTLLTERLARRSLVVPARSGHQRIVTVISVALAAVAAGYALFYAMGNLFYSSDDYPVHAVALLQQRVERANLVTPYGWGDYVIWHVGPNIKVSMDGRINRAWPGTLARVAGMLRWTIRPQSWYSPWPTTPVIA